MAGVSSIASNALQAHDCGPVTQPEAAQGGVTACLLTRGLHRPVLEGEAWLCRTTLPPPRCVLEPPCRSAGTGGNKAPFGCVLNVCAHNVPLAVCDAASRHLNHGLGEALQVFLLRQCARLSKVPHTAHIALLRLSGTGIAGAGQPRNRGVPEGEVGLVNEHEVGPVREVLPQLQRDQRIAVALA